MANASLLFAGMSAAEASSVLIYGADQGSYFSAHHSAGKSYMVQLGSFKNESYANTFKNKMAAKTNEAIHIVHKPNAQVPYHVMVGPFTDIDTLHKVCRELAVHSSNAPVMKRSAYVAPEAPVVYVKKSPKMAYRPKAESVDTYADAAEKSYYFDGASRVATVSVGPAWSSPGKTQTFFLMPDIEKTYVPTNGTSVIGDGELFLGMERSFRAMMRGQLGIAIAGATNVGLSGDIWEDANPNFNNYTYDYNVNHAHVALKAKLIKELEYSFEPYLSGSVGVGFNHAYDFTITPKIYEEVAPPLFQSNTTTAFSYTAGVGLQRRMNPNWIVGLGYEFADWGKSRLAAAPGQTVGSGLALNHLYTNELQLSLTYQPKMNKFDTK